ncbi:MAG: HNH endonuclease [Alistipes sp.]|nr:HNH endonuclease [Alistipes sp.]
MKRRDWIDDEMILALELYFKLPYNKLHRRTPEIQKLAKLLQRSENSVAIRMVNFAACDPHLTGQGKIGMTAGIPKCLPYWNKFANNKEELFWLAENIKAKLIGSPIESNFDLSLQGLEGKEREAVIKQKINQDAFRLMILANYNEMCAISGINIPQLLIASHIIPWADNKEERLNPENGICLSTLYDKAFDKGLIGIRPDDYTVILSKELKSYVDKDFYKIYFEHIEDKPIKMPKKHSPNRTFLQYHIDNIFSKHN